MVISHFYMLYINLIKATEPSFMHFDREEPAMIEPQSIQELIHNLDMDMNQIAEQDSAKLTKPTQLKHVYNYMDRDKAR